MPLSWVCQLSVTERSVLCPLSSVRLCLFFFEKNFAVILVEGRGCGSRSHPCEAATYIRGSCPSAPRGLPPVLCGGGASPGFTRACSPRHITACNLETGPWAMFPHSFSYHPPPSHGMSRLVVRVCLHILKCCLYYFLEILDYISSESLVPSSVTFDSFSSSAPGISMPGLIQKRGWECWSVSSSTSLLGS